MIAVETARLAVQHARQEMTFADSHLTLLTDRLAWLNARYAAIDKKSHEAASLRAEIGNAERKIKAQADHFAYLKMEHNEAREAVRKAVTA